MLCITISRAFRWVPLTVASVFIRSEGLGLRLCFDRASFKMGVDVIANFKIAQTADWFCFSEIHFKGESVVASILPSRMEVSYCTSGFFS